MSSVPPGGGQAVEAERRAAAPHQALGLWWLAPVGLALAGVLLAGGDLRAYGYAVAATLAVLAVLRAVLPARWAGGLVARSRGMDVMTMGLLAVAVGALTTTLRLG